MNHERPDNHSAQSTRDSLPDQAQPIARGAAQRRSWRVPVALSALAAVLLALGALPRLHANSALAAQVAAQAAPTVSVVMPRAAPSSQELLLPGSVMPAQDASIFARTSGYIAHWNTDIGAHVKAGATLAVIQTPELDAQLRQAHADEATAQANFDFAQVSARRWQEMLKTQSVAQQDVDMKVGDMQAKRAILASAKANVQRLTELVSYEKVTAPFDGIVTARNVDVGALVTAGGTAGTGATAGELFHVSQIDTLDVYVDVPQDDAPFVRAGTHAYLTVQQYPGRQFAATVARTTGAIDPASRTMRVELDIDNRDGTLLPGAYAQAHLALQVAKPALDLPVSALLFRPDGVTVAIVDSAGKVQLKTVKIGRDFGTHLEITSGLAATDRVIDNPGDSLTSGAVVQVAHTGAQS
jgi:membrane fusion protein (multidrug efflux system)